MRKKKAESGGRRLKGPADQPGTAESYDRQAADSRWRGPEILFSLCRKFTHPGEHLLDIGIGTGLSSIRFHRIGLKIFGIDNSPEILEACRAKAFTEELKLFDLRQSPLPYAENAFHHVIAVGVLHLFENPSAVFSEVERILRPGGTFAFTIIIPDSDRDFPPPQTHMIRSPEGVAVYAHGDEIVTRLLRDSGFSRIENKPFSMEAWSGGPTLNVMSILARNPSKIQRQHSSFLKIMKDRFDRTGRGLRL